MTTEVLGDEIDAGAFWRTLGERPIGATLVTAQGSEGPAGFLGLSAAHVTAQPPTMLVSVDRKTSALATLLEAGHYAVSFLPEGCADLAGAFGGKGEKSFEPGKWGTLVTGAPVHVDALGIFDCEIEKVVQHGDVSILIGRVRGVRFEGQGTPLTFFRGKFLGD